MRSHCFALLIIASLYVGCGDQDATDPRVPDTAADPTFRPLPDASGGDDAADDIGDEATTDAPTGPPPDDVETIEDTIQEADQRDIVFDQDTNISDAASPDDVTSPPPLSPGPLARGVRIARVDIYQSVRLPWMLQGQATSGDIPVIAHKDATLRVFVATDPTWTPQSLTARVVIADTTGARAFVDTQFITASSQEGLTSSTLNVQLPAAALTPTAAASVALIAAPNIPGDAAPDGTPHPAAWPTVGGAAPLNALTDTGPLKLTLVPFRYDADGSSRLPDLSPTQLATYEALLRALYPYNDVQLTVHAPIPWASTARFGSINQALVQLRDDEAAPDDVYYYGLLQPADTFSAYCGGSCTTGQSYTVSDASSGTYRVGSGVGFPGEDSAWTLAHELGHMHGRGHAPCGVNWWSDDDDYPHSGGSIGTWGWDARANAFKPPADWTDLMGYCDDLWISDYTYDGFYRRASEVRLSVGQLSSPPAPRPYRFLTLPAHTSPSPPTWGPLATLKDAHSGAWVEVTSLDAHGQPLLSAAVPAIPTGEHGDRDLLIPAHLLAPPAATLSIEGAQVPLP